MKLIKTVSRTTRRAFRKKLVMFGISTFMCLALTATGFAAWMLSSNAREELAGNIEVAAVSEAGIEIENLVFADENVKNFKFEPVKNDVSGPVRWDGDDAHVENMKVGFTWTLVNYQNVKETFIDFKIPATIQKLIDDDYIAIPEQFVKQGATEEIGNVTYTVYRYNVPTIEIPTNSTPVDGVSIENILTYKITNTGTAGEPVANIDFALTLTINWGEKFNKTNPSLFYDTYEVNGVVTDEKYLEIKNTLNELKAAAHGITKDDALAKITDLELKNALANATVGEILGHLDEANQESLFGGNHAIPAYYLVVNATAK